MYFHGTYVWLFGHQFVSTFMHLYSHTSISTFVRLSSLVYVYSLQPYVIESINSDLIIVSLVKEYQVLQVHQSGC